ncbi:MAG: amidohydrolase family protein [Actinomycetota bacterium]|nr:amidohydrolase family protein [Actinomycetota bacterium]
MTTLLRSATLADGSIVDVVIDDGRITEVARAFSVAGAEVIHDLCGYVLLPAPAEPHAHLDKALTADVVANPRGDLMGAIESWQAHRAGLSASDIAARARRAARLAVANGVTALRTHVDVGADIELAAVEALLDVRREMTGLLDLQIVALVGRPTSGLEGADNRARLRAALDAGVDIGGGCPHVDPDPKACLDACFEIAGEFDRPIDLHMDENLDPESLDVRYMAEVVQSSGWERGAVASHCVSLGVQPLAVQERIAEEIAEAGVGVVTLPQTNLFLQGRDHPTSTPRGLTAIRPLLDAGVTLGAGGDNLQDPFNTVGRGDPLETAALLVMAGHLTPEEAYRAVSVDARQAMGLEAPEITAGAPAELLAVHAATLREAVACAPASRMVLHRGEIVAQTSVRSEIITPTV